MNEMYLGQPPCSVVKWCKKKYPKPTPLTIQALKAFTDDDLILSVELYEHTALEPSVTITPEFSINCYNATGTKLSSYAFKETLTSSSKVNLLSKMKEAGIDVDSMKIAGAKFEIVDVKQWTYGQNPAFRVHLKFIGSTYGCFQLYGSIDETFKNANGDWAMGRMFSDNQTVKAIGITYDKCTSNAITQCESMFSNCQALTSCAVTDENGIQHKSRLAASYYAIYDSMFANCQYLTDAPLLMLSTCTGGDFQSMFYGCSALAGSVRLPAVKLEDSCYTGMFERCSDLEEIHYPASIENDSTFTSMPGSPKFGATNATVYFDL